MTDIILASASPRRAALLQQMGLSFRVLPSSLDENGSGAALAGEDPAGRAVALARAKATEVAARAGRGIIIGADTIVECEGEVLGKPQGTAQAVAFLERLAGRTHRVITAVAVVEAATGRTEVAASTTLVRMRTFGTGEAAAYVATGEPMDKAGAYGIQGRGALLVEGIQGDYFTVVGLPVALLATLLRRFGVEVWTGGDLAADAG